MPNTAPNLDTVVCEAIDIPDPDARAAYLKAACGTDAALLQQVEVLVAAHFRAGGSFLEHSARSDVTAAFIPATDADTRPEVGTAIGAYTLREQIGEGGMGLVFVAEQTHPVRRKVALKVIKPGMDSRQVVARFEAERQALALMDHPNIAKVLDAGTTPEGRPYFVMELVKGEPVTDYCDRNRLNLRQRLELFLQVCQAVQHAHQKGVIHRDLKPSNILIAVHDVTPVAKVIDFGIAKAVGQSLTDRTLYTAVAQFVGTPLYMSPEQAGQSSLDVDTRTDVYALGVLLYELLTGTTPIDPETFRKAGLDEVRRIIREDEPPRPSARMSTLKAAVLSTVADKRGADPRRLARQVRGELDWVVMKCLEKDRNRRYESASALAADVQRYLGDEPVSACPPSAGYRLRKLARRNKVALVTASIVAVALIAGTAVSVWQAMRADAARRYADERLQEESKAKAEADAHSQRAAENYGRARAAVKQMLTRVATNEVGAIPEMKETRRNLLEDAARFYTELLRLSPADADAHAERGEVYETLGRYDDAIANYLKAIDLRPGDPALHRRAAVAYGQRQDMQNRDHFAELAHARRVVELRPDEADGWYLVATAYARLGRGAEARAAIRELEARDTPTNNDWRLATLYGVFLLNDPAAALPHARRIVERFPKKPEARARLGATLRALGRHPEALAEYDEAIRCITHRNNLGNAHHYEGRGDVLSALGRHADAVADYGRAVALIPDRAFTYRRRAEAHFSNGDYPAALADVATVVRLSPNDIGELGSITPKRVAACPDPAFRRGMLEQAGRAIELSGQAPVTYVARAAFHDAFGDRAKAAEDRAAAVAGYGRRLADLQAKSGRDPEATLRVISGVQATLGHNLLDLGRHAEAEQVLRDCLTTREKIMPDGWLRFNVMSLLGDSLLGQKQYAEAEPLLIRGFDGMKQREGSIPANAKIRLTEAVERLVHLYEATGRPEKAQEWRGKLPRTVAPPPRLKPSR